MLKTFVLLVYKNKKPLGLNQGNIPLGPGKEIKIQLDEYFYT